MTHTPGPWDRAWMGNEGRGTSGSGSNRQVILDSLVGRYGAMDLVVADLLDHITYCHERIWELEAAIRKARGEE